MITVNVPVQNIVRLRHVPFVNDRRLNAYRNCTRALYSTWIAIIMEAPGSPQTGSTSSRDCCECIHLKRERAKLLCPHCNEMVSKTTFYRHKSTFYNRSLRKWGPAAVGSKADNGSTSSSDDDNEVGVADSEALLQSTVQHGRLGMEVATIRCKSSIQSY